MTKQDITEKSFAKETAPSAKLSTQEIVELSKRHSIFSWSAQSSLSPMTMSRGDGIYFWDNDGNKYVDLNSQLMCVNIGHGNKKVIEAIKNQAEELAYAGPNMATSVRARFGKLLAEKTPKGLDKFFFTLGGAEANENALRMVRAVTGRFKIMARYRSYHGATSGAISLTGDYRRWANEPGIPGVVRFFDPYHYRSHSSHISEDLTLFTKRCLDEIEEIMIYEGTNTIAAVFIETVTGTNGLIVPPPGYIEGLRALCDKYGILLVCDEVMCGLGRTGRWFAVDHFGVVPDIITMAKGLTSAYLPLGAVAVSEKIADYFENNTFYGGLTYNAHPLSLAAAEACINVMDEEDMVNHTKNMGEVLKSYHLQMKENHRCVGDIRSIGLFGAIELVKNRETKEPMAPFTGNSPEMAKLGSFLKENGIFAFISKNLLFTNPPLCITKNELEEVFSIIDKGLSLMDQYSV